MSAPPRPRRSRLALRIYLVGLGQLAAVAFTYYVLHALFLRPAMRHYDPAWAPGAVSHVAPLLGDDARLRAELSRIAREQRSKVSVWDGSGRLVATTSDHPRPLDRDERARLGEGMLPLGRHRGVAVALDEGRAYAVVEDPPPPFPTRDLLVALAVALSLAALASVLLARSLSRPLAVLTRATRAFGKGRLDARANLRRGDELGEVAAAFDETAARVKQLLTAQRELLANVSHELRTPLARIAVALDLAEEQAPPEGRRALADMRDDLCELDRLVSDLLTAARLDLATSEVGPFAAPIVREPVDLHAIAARAAMRFRALHEGHALVLELPRVDEVRAGAAPLADPRLVQRAVDNLLDNAARYSDPGRPVELALAADDGDGALAIEVRDRGIGVDERDLPRLFAPFFRTDRSRARRTGGVGLGLALVRRIAEAHGGRATAARREGGGSVFRVTLPREGCAGDGDRCGQTGKRIAPGPPRAN